MLDLAAPGAAASAPAPSGAWAMPASPPWRWVRFPCACHAGLVRCRMPLVCVRQSFEIVCLDVFAPELLHLRGGKNVIQKSFKK